MKFNLDDLSLVRFKDYLNSNILQEKDRVQKLIDSELNGLGAFETT